MKAIVVRHAGGPEVLEYTEVPTPTVKPGWSLVKVRGFGVNHSEIFTREGSSPSVQFPRILGIEAVGEVAESTDERLNKGQKVVSIMGEMGRAFDGGYAEYVLLPNQQIYPIQSSLSWAELAAVPETYYTAFGIFKSLQLKVTDKVLIRAATSGVGIAELHLIKGLNPAIRVTGTTRSSKKVEALLAEGFDHVLVAPQSDRLPDGTGKFDKIIDLIGPLSLRDSLAHVNQGGIVNMTGELGHQWELDGFNPVDDIPNGAYLTGFMSGDVDLTAIQELFDFIEQHHIDVTPVKVFSLQDVPAAHAYLESQQSFGKVVVLP